VHRLALLATALAAAGCGGSGASAPALVSVEGGEYAYTAPATIEGGLVSMRFVNTGKEPHEFALARIGEGHTLDEAVAALNESDDVGWLEDVGGVPLLSPGGEITLTRALEPGRYGLLCHFPSPDGQPHVDLGMQRQFEVTGESDASPPTPDAVITATANGFSVPELEAGVRTLELRNDLGGEPSWYVYVQAVPGATTDDFEAWIESGQKGASPLTFVGAMQSFGSGESRFVTLELEAGTTYWLEDDPGGLEPVELTPR
jgi:uncharacterized cupredoxin-like copper-binding protein